MSGFETDYQEEVLRYRLCVRCFRAVPAHSNERYCINDGTPLLEGCPWCGAAISNPYTRFCGSCGRGFAQFPQQKEHSL